MSPKRSFLISVITCAVTLAAGLTCVPAMAATANTQTSSARVNDAVDRLEAARERLARIDERVAATTARLDGVIAEQQQARSRLRARSLGMYRSGDTSLLSVIIGASTFEEFAARWDLLKRMNRQDAADLEALENARIDVQRSARSLLKLQEEQARAVESTNRELAAARKEFAASQAALKAYEARAANSAPKTRGAVSRKSDSTQQLRGSGEWKTAVASHYGRNFTGRGASGEAIGPYSMIVAHKTLPFGTLVEIEYGGKRAVARVADRGPYTAGRTFDLGPGVVRVLNFSGVHEIRYRVIAR